MNPEITLTINKLILKFKEKLIFTIKSLMNLMSTKDLTKIKRKINATKIKTFNKISLNLKMRSKLQSKS